MEVNTKAHEEARTNEAERQRLMQRDQTDGRPNEWSCGEVSPRSCRADFPRGQNEEDKAKAVAEETDEAGHRQSPSLGLPAWQTRPNSLSAGSTWAGVVH